MSRLFKNTIVNYKKQRQKNDVHMRFKNHNRMLRNIVNASFGGMQGGMTNTHTASFKCVTRNKLH